MSGNSPGQTAEELALMGADWCAESLVLALARARKAESDNERLRVRLRYIEANVRAALSTPEETEPPCGPECKHDGHHHHAECPHP